MATQHTFKSTKTTKWIDSILDDPRIPDKSKFIRDLLMTSLISMGVAPKYLEAPPPPNLDVYKFMLGVEGPVQTRQQVAQVPQVPDPPPTKVIHVTQEKEPTSPKTSIDVTHTPTPLGLDDAPDIEIKELSVDDLDSKLDGMDFG